MERALVVATLLAAAGGSVNYCGANMCARSNAHTFCQYARPPSSALPDESVRRLSEAKPSISTSPAIAIAAEPGPGPRCTGYIEDPLSDEEKARVLARLNRRRAEAARGALRQLPSAGNMLKLRWVEELSREAQRWADQCAPPATPEERDVCRDLYSISVGQCVASVVGEAPGLRAESLADTWYLQGLQYRGNVSYSTSNRRYDLDFAQMLWAHTYLVGCARSRFMSAVNGRMRTVIRLVCNMAPRGPAGALWLPAAPASACPPRSRPDPDLPALCSYLNDTIDVYDVSNEMNQEEQIVFNAVLEIERNSTLDHPGSLDEIYLTNMAIATLIPASTVPYPNVLQKRDIFEPILQEEEETEVAGTKLHTLDDVIVKMVRDKSRTRENEVIKPNVVGRPKTYHINELNSNFPDKDFNYAKTRAVETTTKREPEAYVEYEYQESSEISEGIEYILGTEHEVKLTSISTHNQNLTEHLIETASTTTSRTTELLSSSVADNFTLETNVTNDALKRLLELTKKTEERPFDPETSRQLQEALERMEMSLETELPGKVRRELRRPPPENRDDPAQRDLQESREPVPEVSHDSKPAPMVEMMTKYLPFFKMTGSAASLQLDIYCVCVMFILYV